MLLQIGVVVLIVVVLAMVVFGFSGASEQLSSKGPITNGVVLFYADWCPACQSIKADWAATKLGMPEVVFEDVNIDNKEIAKSREQQYGVSAPSVPTIVIVKNGVGTKYSGNRDKASFMTAFKQI